MPADTLPRAAGYRRQLTDLTPAGTLARIGWHAESSVNATEFIRVARPGGPERLELQSGPVSEPGREVRVAVEAAGVAFADVMVREGRYPGVRAPGTPGYDLVGRIDAIGPDVAHLAMGLRVAALTVTGAYARHVVIPASWVVAAPEELDAADAVALVLNYVTAWQMLRRNTAAEAGSSVLVHGAAGGVGTALLELCRLQGVRAFGTASRGKHDLVTELGGVPIDFATEDFVARIRAETPHCGVDAAFDHVGGAHLGRSYAALRATGVLVSYGGLGAFSGGRLNVVKGVSTLARQPRFRPLDLLAANKAVVCYDIAGRRHARPDWFARDLTELFALAQARALHPVIAARLPLSRAREAHELLGHSDVRGKIVLDMSLG